MKNLHLSYYTIPVKLDSEKNKYLLVHGYTGAIDIVSEDVWKQMENALFDSFSDEFLMLLQKRGYLTIRKKEEEFNYVSHFAQLLHRAQSKLYKTFGFIVTYNCNFRCPYCFENIISKHGDKWSKLTFSQEMVDKVYSAINQIEPNKELRSNQMLLYGGEPLLRENVQIVKYILEKGEQLGYSFKIITNGYDLNYFLDILSPINTSLLQVTIDGNEKHHNERRFHSIEGASFWKILNNIGFILKKEIRVLIRVNTDNNNFNDFNSLKEYCRKLGYLESPYFKIYSSILREFDTNADSSLTANIDYIPTVSDLNQKHKSELNNEIRCQDFGISRHFYDRLKNKSRCRFYSASCSSQYGSFIFDPKGDIYSCIEIVGRQEYVIGNYLGEEIQWTKAKEYWFNRNVSNVNGCKWCKFSLLCGGPCLARVPYSKDGFSAFYCENYRLIFASCVNKAYEAYKNNKPIY